MPDLKPFEDVLKRKTIKELTLRNASILTWIFYYDNIHIISYSLKDDDG